MEFIRKNPIQKKSWKYTLPLSGACILLYLQASYVVPNQLTQISLKTPCERAIYTKRQIEAYEKAPNFIKFADYLEHRSFVNAYSQALNDGASPKKCGF